MKNDDVIMCSRCGESVINSPIFHEIDSYITHLSYEHDIGAAKLMEIERKYQEKMGKHEVENLQNKQELRNVLQNHS